MWSAFLFTLPSSTVTPLCTFTSLEGESGGCLRLKLRRKAEVSGVRHCNPDHCTDPELFLASALEQHNSMLQHIMTWGESMPGSVCNINKSDACQHVCQRQIGLFLHKLPFCNSTVNIITSVSCVATSYLKRTVN